VNNDAEHATEPPAESPASESQPAQQSAPNDQDQEQEIPMATEAAASTPKKKTTSKKPATPKTAKTKVAKPKLPKPSAKPEAKKKAEKAKLSGSITDAKPQQETYLRLIFGDSGAITLRVMSSATDSGRQENRDLVIKAIRDLVK